MTERTQLRASSIAKPALSGGKPGRVFLVGAPRSGTTLLQAMLAAHPLVRSFPELHFFVWSVWNNERRAFGIAPTGLRGRLSWLRRELMQRAGLASRGSHEQLRSSLALIGREDLAGLVLGRRWSLADMSASFVRVLDRAAIDAGAAVWVEKTPIHYGYIDVIERHVPDARFIHLVRDGRAVVGSLVDAARTYPDRYWGQTYPDLAHCIGAWNTATRAALAHRERAHHLAVSYEALVDGPEPVLRRVAAFCGLDYDAAMARDYPEAAAALLRSDEPWKSRVSEELRRSSKFAEVLDEWHQRHVVERLLFGGEVRLD